MNQTLDNEQTQYVKDNNDEVEIDLVEVFGVLLHKLPILLITAIICGAIGFLLSDFVVPEKFESTTKIYILNKESTGTVSYNDIQIGTQLTKDYSELIMSRDVIEAVISQLNLDDDYESLQKRISVETPTDTRIVSITVTDLDPAVAQKIADTIREVAAESITQIMDIKAVNLVERANLPTEKSSPSISKWSLIGAAIGFLLAAAIILLRYVLDDTIKTSDDVEKYLGLYTLALIPLDEQYSKKSNQREKNLKKEKKAAAQSTRSSQSSKTASSSVKTSSISSQKDSDEDDEPLEIENIKLEKPGTEVKIENRITPKKTF